MTTVGIEEGRNYARVNLKLTERARPQRGRRRSSRRRSARRFAADCRASSSRSASTGRSGSTCSDPIRTRCRRSCNEFADKVAKIPGIADLENSDKAANPALSIRLNNDAAADLGITVQQVGATIRPLLAGDTVSYWLGARRPELRGQRAAAEGQPAPRRRPGQPLSDDEQARPGRRDADGAAAAGRRDRRDDESADHQAPGAAAARRALRERRGPAVGRRRQATCRKIINEWSCPRATASTSAGQQKDMQESFQAAVAALGLAVIFIYLILASQFASFTQPVAIMAVAAVLADRRVPRAAAHAARRSTSSRSSASSC